MDYYPPRPSWVPEFEDVIKERVWLLKQIRELIRAKNWARRGERKPFAEEIKKTQDRLADIKPAVTAYHKEMNR